MSRAGRWIVGMSGASTAARPAYGASVVSGVVFLCSIGIAQSGPCTTQIIQLERQIAGDGLGPNGGATAPQSIAAQLHHQPTPSTVGRAEQIANKDGDAALDRARSADASGDAAGCNQALTEARRLYEINP